MQIIKVSLTSVLSIAVLFIIAKIMGHKQIAQLDFFDYISGITIGSIAAELATELENPLNPLIAMVVYGVVSFLLNLLTSKVPKSRKFINGTPTVIMNEGKIYRKNMKKAKLDLSEFMVMCRQEGYFNLNDIHTAVFEYNGRLTILPVSTKRPATPTDMNLAPTQEHISTELIMDGRVMEENLSRMGLDDKWLEKKIREKGYKSPREIYLCTCDKNHRLSIFPGE